MKEVVIDGQIKIQGEWLIFNNNSSLKLSELSDIEIHYDPKVKIIIPFII